MSSERVPIEVVRKQASLLSQAPLLADLTHSLGAAVFILNQQRQIVYATEGARKLSPTPAAQDLLGRRPGEALGCVHAGPGTGSCGATEYCEYCGALRAIVSSLQGKTDRQECRLLRVMNLNTEAMDLLVHSAPFTYGQEQFTILSVSDISHEKRRHSLERVFYQDLANLAGGLETFTALLEDRAPASMKAELGQVHAGLQQLIDEVLTQKELTAAENNRLEPRYQTLNPTQILLQVQESCQKLPAARERFIRISPRAAAGEMISDGLLLRRVLGLLVKNALEAISPGQTVSLDCQRIPGGMQFQVHNPSLIPRETQLQLFKRSYTTKGAGRGLGTYSVKLLTERYLKGQVSFRSTHEEGTVFSVNLPEKPPGP